ncbi:MAG: Cobalt-zinc-cadmium resistance protein CzcA [Chlamydiae bacterium]|nr:Cobalt-zinc-cadmium resistance protein CzcA [Chlamydiota bacterium]
MFRWVVRSSLQFRYLVIFAAMILVVFGITKLRDMPVDVFPEFAPPLVEIQTEELGMSPVEVEELITIPMEESLRGTPQLDVMRSKSVTGLSSIKLIFKPGTDILYARQLVQERLELTKNDLPSFANPVMLQPLSATSRVMKIGLSSNKYDLMDLSMIAYWKMRFHLMRVPGVANVAIWGERLKALQIQVDPNLMQAHDVSMNKILEVSSEALDFGLLPYSTAAKTRIDGFIETPNQRLDIQHILPVFEPKDLAAIPLKESDTDIITIGDVADVKWEHPLLIGDAVINDGPGLMLIVEKFPWANTLQVTQGVEEVLDALRPGLADIEIDSNIFRPATFIEMSIANLNKALIFGCILVVIVLIAFLYEWRVALISCMAIPLSLLSAGIVLYLRDATINTMVLAGFVIALGAVVDDAIVDIENIVRRLRQNRKEGKNKSTASIILDASLEVRKAIIYSTLIEVAALLPVFFMGGLSGSFFKPLALSYAIAVVASTVVALTVTPALGFILLRNAPLEKRESPLVRWLVRGYHSILGGIIEKPSRAYFTVGAIVLAGIVVLPQLGQELLPSFKERDFLMHWLTKPGTSHEEMYRITETASKELRTIPGVRNFGAHIGRALVADEVVGIHFTENWVSVDPNAPYDETVNAIQETVDGYPGIYRDVQTYLKERIREVLTGAGEAIVVRVYGPELSVLYQKAEEVKQALEGIEGLTHLHVELQIEVPHIQVKVNLAKAGKYGLKPGDVRRASATMMSGIEVSDIHRKGKVYDVMVWSKPEFRNSIDDIRGLLLDTPDGGRVRLEDVAEVDILPTPNVIKREGASRRIDIGANVSGRDLGSVVHDVEQNLQKVDFPLGYYSELLGEYAERQATQKRMLAVSIVAVSGIYLFLQTSFGSWTLASISFLTLPAALVGGVLAIFFSGGIISLGSLVGFLTILGIAARNGIMLINHYQHLERYEGETFGPKLVLRGAQERLSPILMTAITTGLALLPLVVAGDIPGHEIELPTAVVILGGLVTSTLLNLFIIPPLYLRFHTAEK